MTNGTALSNERMERQAGEVDETKQEHTRMAARSSVERPGWATTRDGVSLVVAAVSGLRV
jgi:hypothetical protein